MRIAMNSNTSAPTPAEVIFFNGKIATQDDKRSFADALAVANGRILASGSRDAVMRHVNANTRQVDLKGRTVIPGLNDSHLHIIRGGLNFNMELRWDGVPSLADALDMLRKQVARTPAPQWVRVVGGWNEFQFAERRSPTLEEINAIAPDTPVFILHLYDSALLNAAALRAVGPDASAEAVRSWIANLHDFYGLAGDYDFRDGSQRGLNEKNLLIMRWDAAKGTWTAVSGPGGAAMRH